MPRTTSSTRKTSTTRARTGSTSARKKSSTRARTTSSRTSSRAKPSTARKSTRSKASGGSTTTRGGSRTRSAASRNTARAASRRSSRTPATETDATTQHAALVVTDHEFIRRWAEERGAQPSCVRGTGDANDIGVLRLDFPGYSGEESLEPITWQQWFEKFDERDLALLYQESTAGDESSNFNRLVNRSG